MYHPAAALRTPAIERESYADIAAVPSALIDARRRRDDPTAQPTPAPTTNSNGLAAPEPVAAPQPTDPPDAPLASSADDPAPQLTLF
jgi:hypothetical protein